MSVSNLSVSSQNYLKAIWNLSEWSDEPVTASAMAAQVGVKLSTASDAVRKLAEQGFLEHTPYGSVSLTSVGRTHALTMVRRHRLIESFLVDVLGYRWDQVHDEAENLEHAVSDFLIERIDQYLGSPVRDPHGDPIPHADGTVVMPKAILLTELGPGQSAIIERISDADPELLQFFTEHNVGIGSNLKTRPTGPYSDNVEVVIDQSATPLPLGKSATDAVWVKPVQ